jgi:hypothetical protein
VPGGYDKSDANQRIANFQKHIEHRNHREVWSYRNSEIESFSVNVAAFLKGNFPPDRTAIVPMFVSSPRSSDTHNDRMIRLAEGVADRLPGLAVRDVFDAKMKLVPAKSGGVRFPNDLRPNVDFEGFGGDVPDLVILLDDVLTSGSHFRVCSDLIMSAYSSIFTDTRLCIAGTDLRVLITASSRRAPYTAAASFPSNSCSQPQVFLIETIPAQVARSSPCCNRKGADIS